MKILFYFLQLDVGDDKGDDKGVGSHNNPSKHRRLDSPRLSSDDEIDSSPKTPGSPLLAKDIHHPAPTTPIKRAALPAPTAPLAFTAPPAPTAPPMRTETALPPQHMQKNTSIICLMYGLSLTLDIKVD